MGFVLGVIATLFCIGIYLLGSKLGLEIAIDKAKQGGVVKVYGKKWKITAVEVSDD